MVYSQLFVSDEEQQNALKRAHQEQTIAGLTLAKRGSLGGVSSATNQFMLQTQAAAGLGQPGLAGASAGLMAGGFGSQLGAQFGGQLSSQFSSQLSSQLGTNLSSQLGSQFTSQLGSQLGSQLASHQLPAQLGGQLGAPSLLDVQRAESILAAAAMANNPQLTNPVSQLAMMNATNQQLLQSRLGSTASLLGPNTQLPLAHDASLFAKNHALSLATANGVGIGAGGMFNASSALEQGRLKRRRSASFAPDGLPQKKSANAGSICDIKLATELAGLEDGQRSQVSSTQQQIQHIMRMREEAAPKSRKKAKTFPVKLMQALMENPNEDAVAWLPDGKSFVIVNPDIFVDTVLKRVFKECKYASFVRKLHRWGFVRLTSGTGTDCFHHPLFQQNRMDMCAKIICTPRDSSKASEAEKRAAAAQQQAITDKPPSLAGVEKFFRTKAMHSKSGEEEKTEDGGKDTPKPVNERIDAVASVVAAALSNKREEV